MSNRTDVRMSGHQARRNWHITPLLIAVAIALIGCSTATKLSTTELKVLSDLDLCRHVYRASDESVHAELLRRDTSRGMTCGPHAVTILQEIVRDRATLLWERPPIPLALLNKDDCENVQVGREATVTTEYRTVLWFGVQKVDTHAAHTLSNHSNNTKYVALRKKTEGEIQYIEELHALPPNSTVALLASDKIPPNIEVVLTGCRSFSP